MCFIHGSENELKRKRRVLDKGLDALAQMPSYFKRSLIDNERFVLRCVSYPEYPVRVLKLHEYTAVIEGRMYALAEAEIADAMNKLADIVFEEKREALRTWLMNTDGDFLIFLFRRGTNDVAILNDALGRLPFYCFNNGEMLVLAREIRFIANLVKKCTFDRMGIAQFLLFGYPLGRRTLLEGVERLPPATLVRTTEDIRKTRLDSLHTFRFQSRPHNDRTVECNAKELVTLFRESCRHMANRNGTNVVSLSGGLDSRAVAVGLHEEGIPFVAATFLKHNRRTSADMTIAALLAKSYKWDWQPYALDPPRGKHFLQLLRIKSGLNYLGMSYILPYFEQIRERYPGNIIYLTGDGGDKVLPDLRPNSHLNSLKELADFILHVHRRSSLKMVAAISQLDDSEIRAELLDILAAYPEQDLAQKYVHFVIYERGMKWLFEGEDRNRYYFWSATPFYSIRFFNYAMNCPNDQKRNYVLYRHFLKYLSRPAAKLLEAREWLPPISRLYGPKRMIELLMEERLPSPIRIEVERLMFHYELDSPIISCLRNQLDSCDSIGTHLSGNALKKVMEECRNHSRFELENLFSVTSLIEDLSKRHSTIEEYLDTRFH